MTLPFTAEVIFPQGLGTARWVSDFSLSKRPIRQPPVTRDCAPTFRGPVRYFSSEKKSPKSGRKKKKTKMATYSLELGVALIMAISSVKS